ncbi:hypothetical protein SFRURICE_015165 [Spodoptera frugiperda]|nr:hypothetical protein SFRURICE_015165 [Spodoptera frugiperda]
MATLFVGEDERSIILAGYYSWCDVTALWHCMCMLICLCTGSTGDSNYVSSQRLLTSVTAIKIEHLTVDENEKIMNSDCQYINIDMNMTTAVLLPSTFIQRGCTSRAVTRFHNSMSLLCLTPSTTLHDARGLDISLEDSHTYENELRKAHLQLERNGRTLPKSHLGNQSLEAACSLRREFMVVRQGSRSNRTGMPSTHVEYSIERDFHLYEVK